MKFSVIIPTLNEAKLLPNLLSLLNDIELREEIEFDIIISDGGSSDRTIEIALDKAEMVIANTNRQKQNIACGRNCGANLANGSIFIFINADVRINDLKLFFTNIENIFNDKEYLAMTFRVKVFPEDETISDKFFHFIYNEYFHFLNLVGLGMGRGECQVVRKEIYERLGGYDESLAAGEDFDFFRRIRKLGKIFFSTYICVYESPRRFRKFGYYRVTASWIKNGISVWLRKRSISANWEEVR